MNNLENIQKSLEQISNEISVQVDAENIDELCAHLAILSSLGGTMSYAGSRAKMLYEINIAKALVKLKEGTTKWSPNEARDMAKSMCATYGGLLDLTINLDRHLSKKIDSIRTMISMRKSELENALRAGNQ